MAVFLMGLVFVIEGLNLLFSFMSQEVLGFVLIIVGAIVVYETRSVTRR